MQFKAFFSTPLLLLATASPMLLMAQFQQPTADELKMTADPKAPGAAAVYLNIEEVTDDPLHYHSFYARIKVLSEKGKELATVELPYVSGDSKITDIKGRTIHSDGTILPLEVKPENLLMMKSGDLTVNRKVFNLPSVEVGSILEYRYELRYDDDRYSSPDWEIQRPYFVHKAHYSFTPFKAFLPGSQNITSSYLEDEHGNPANSLVWWTILPEGKKIEADASGRFSMDLTDIPARPQEEWMPPIHSLLYHVAFYYLNSNSVGGYWTEEAKYWGKDVDHFAEPTKQIREAADGIVASADSDLDKAKKLYKAVQALDNTDFSREKTASERKQLKLKAVKRAEDTWAQKSGSSEDIALLYLGLLRAEGLTAYDMKVVDRDQGIFAPGYLNFHQLDDDIILLNIGGKEMVPDGVEAHIDHFLALDDPESNLVAVIKAHGAIGSATSKRLILPGLFFETRGSHPFVDQEKRLEPVDMHYGEQVSDQVVYHLPAGLSVESAPQDAKIPWEGHAVFIVKSKAEPGQITVARTLARAFTFAKPEEYQSLRDFYQKVAAADQQQLVLANAPVATTTPAAKGN